MSALIGISAPASAGLLIPRILHRMSAGGPLTERQRRLGASWAREHPGWQVRDWDDGDLPAPVNQAPFDTAQRVDILRYELLIAHGGVWVDADLECLGSIEPLLDGVSAFCVRADATRLSGAVLGCVPGHPFLEAVVAALPDSVAWCPAGEAAERTGAGLLTRVLATQEALGAPVPDVLAPEAFFGARAGYRPEEQRVVVELDPGLFDADGAAVLGAALDVAGRVPGAEVAIVIRGVATPTPQIGTALSGIIAAIAPSSALPDVVVYGEPEGRALSAGVRVLADVDAAGNARAIRALADWAGIAA